MRLHHDMTVPASTDDVWRALGEIDAIAPCLPGASVERIDEDTVYGSMTVKVGPITVAYKGRAVIDERDDADHRMVVHASGREQRGVGTAQATLVVAVHDQPSGGSEVDVDTDLTVTGRPAQFGRGVMADIGDRVIAEFADRLSRQLAESAATAGRATEAAEAAADRAANAAAATDGATAAGGGPAAAAETAPTPQAGRDEPLDLGPILLPVVRRAALLAALALALALVERRLRNRLRTRRR
ncbi:SRPBCC family protein [Streptacidiphilus jiangxiensis]|uniref:Carbon monoxide dehydrogenase subunit G n=1 Tax=Streptacidiphilus jiangxiensis TaxID=235985 RepID=A0A1H7N9F2_STRJI|nr:SRPBCC family protein [Streptacidiphilus jiangxiensis]SEL20256.1 Carbon monoxide dehydrogenase subunit G [Streptacidiphilus jiangxiensis]